MDYFLPKGHHTYPFLLIAFKNLKQKWFQVWRVIFQVPHSLVKSLTI